MSDDRTDPKSASRVTPNIDVPGSSPSPIRLRLQSADGVKRRRWTPDTGHQSSFVDTISASAPEDDIGAPAEGHLRTSLTVPPPDNPQHEKWYVSGAQAGHVERNDSTCTLDPSPPDSASSLPGSNPSSSGPSEVMIPEEVSAGEKHGAWNDGLSMGAQLPEPDEKIVRSRTAPPYLTGGRGPCLEVRETSRALGRGPPRTRMRHRSAVVVHQHSFPGPGTGGSRRLSGSEEGGGSPPTEPFRLGYSHRHP